MIWANDIFQPKLCAIDFSVDSSELGVQTKFCKGDNLQIQLSLGGSAKRSVASGTPAIYRWYSLVKCQIEDGVEKMYEIKGIPDMRIRVITANEAIGYKDFIISSYNVANATIWGGTEIGAYFDLMNYVSSVNAKTISAIGGNNGTTELWLRSETRINPGALMRGFFGGRSYTLTNESSDYFDSDASNGQLGNIFFSGTGNMDYTLDWIMATDINLPYPQEYRYYSDKLLYAILDHRLQVKHVEELSLLNEEVILDSDGNIETVYYHLGTGYNLEDMASGCYQVQVCRVPKTRNTFDFSKVVADSEIFEILISAEKTILYNFSHYKPLFGCIFNNQTDYMFRLTGSVCGEATEYTSNNSEFDTYDNRNIRTRGFPSAIYQLLIGGLSGIPEATIIKLMLALQCKDLIINGEYALIASGQSKLEEKNSFVDGNKLIALKIQKRANKYISSADKQGLFAGGQAPTLVTKYV